MEVERISQVTGLRVERTGSESERRNRPERDFSETLEQSLDERKEGTKPGRKELEPGDTVSITGGSSPQLASADFVSIAQGGQAGSQAPEGQTRLSMIQRLILSLRGTGTASTPRQPGRSRDRSGDDEPHKPLDTVA